MNNYIKKAKYLGKSEGISLTENKIYEMLGFESGFIRIIDDTDEDYLYDPDLFEIYNEDDSGHKEEFGLLESTK